MKHKQASVALVILLVGAITLPATAYIYPLSSADIRDAYFTGTRNDEQTADFFLEYSHAFPMPKEGPHVSAVSVATPFSQVVEQSGKAGYHPQDAEQEFLGRPMDFLVRVQVDFTTTFPPAAQSGTLSLQPIPNLWDEFKIQLEQDQKIAPKGRRVYLIYSDASPFLFGLSGAILEESYDAEKITGAPATVVVDTPDGQHLETSFNLAKLR
jgi:hypothetical protein